MTMQVWWGDDFSFLRRLRSLFLLRFVPWYSKTIELRLSNEKRTFRRTITSHS